MRQRQVTTAPSPVNAKDDGCSINQHGRVCGRQTIATVSVTCLNEVADTQRLCGVHVIDAQHGRLNCRTCRRKGDGEHKIIVTRVVWDK